MFVSSLRRQVLLPIALAAYGLAAAPLAHADTRLQAYLAAAAHHLPASARTTLAEIEEAPRQLLAMRSYLRAGEQLQERWSWSDERIQSFARSRDHAELVAAVEQVRTTFERQNPGYTVIANTQTRSLDVQLQRWNENGGVARVARHLERAALTELQRAAYPASPEPTHLERFMAFLRSWRPPTAAPLAAPGLSMHGQSRAIDFQIMKDGRVVAGAHIGSVREVWERQGWSAKLQRAIDDSVFVGPLKSPNEPWHYEYARGERFASRQ